MRVKIWLILTFFVHTWFKLDATADPGRFIDRLAKGGTSNDFVPLNVSQTHNETLHQVYNCFQRHQYKNQNEQVANYEAKYGVKMDTIFANGTEQQAGHAYAYCILVVINEEAQDTINKNISYEIAGTINSTRCQRVNNYCGFMIFKALDVNKITSRSIHITVNCSDCVHQSIKGSFLGNITKELDNINRNLIITKAGYEFERPEFHNDTCTSHLKDNCLLGYQEFTPNCTITNSSLILERCPNIPVFIKKCDACAYPISCNWRGWTNWTECLPRKGPYCKNWYRKRIGNECFCVNGTILPNHQSKTCGLQNYHLQSCNVTNVQDECHKYRGYRWLNKTEWGNCQFYGNKTCGNGFEIRESKNCIYPNGTSIADETICDYKEYEVRNCSTFCPDECKWSYDTWSDEKMCEPYSSQEDGESACGMGVSIYNATTCVCGPHNETQKDTLLCEEKTKPLYVKECYKPCENAEDNCQKKTIAKENIALNKMLTLSDTDKFFIKSITFESSHWPIKMVYGINGNINLLDQFNINDNQQFTFSPPILASVLMFFHDDRWTENSTIKFTLDACEQPKYGNWTNGDCIGGNCENNGTYSMTRLCMNGQTPIASRYCIGENTTEGICVPDCYEFGPWSTFYGFEYNDDKTVHIRNRTCSKSINETCDKEIVTNHPEYQHCTADEEADISKCSGNAFDYVYTTAWTPWVCINEVNVRVRNFSNSPNDLIKTKENGSFCEDIYKKVDGQWSVWGNWFPCIPDCGEGIEFRYRNCSNPIPKNGGEYCGTNDTHNRTCGNLDQCPVMSLAFGESCEEFCNNKGLNCTYDMTDLSPEKAFEGKQVEYADVGTYEPKPYHPSCYNKSLSTVVCEGLEESSTKNFSCHAKPEGGSNHQRLCSCVKEEDLAYSAWALWGSCSRTCGEGEQTRNRECAHKNGLECLAEDMVDYQKCSTRPHCPIDATWAPWSEWSGCSKECGSDGVRYKQRERNEPQYGGRNVTGETKVFEECNRVFCPIYAEWGEWGRWAGDCPVCGNTTANQTRSRTYKEIIAANIRMPKGEPTQTIPCEKKEPCKGGEVLFSVEIIEEPCPSAELRGEPNYINHMAERIKEEILKTNPHANIDRVIINDLGCA